MPLPEHRNSAPVMLICSGAEGASSFVNRTWLEFTGRSLEEEVGDGFEDIFHPDYRASVMKEYWDAFQEHRPLTVEFPMRRRDGEYRWMQARWVPRFLDNGRLAGYVGCFSDITEQRSALNASKQAQSATDEKVCR
jgi:PAS domain S-box-containing protein